MIVTSSNKTVGELLVITQNDHAHFAAELLSLWRRDDLPTHPRRRELLLAAREHDNGWREADSSPSRNPVNGRPHDFLSLPVSRRQDRPNAILWLVRNHAEMSDAQIGRLVGTTKPTIMSIREKSHWNFSNLKPVDPVSLGLSSQIELDAARELLRDRENTLARRRTQFRRFVKRTSATRGTTEE